MVSMTYQPDSKVRWIVMHYSATPIERDFTAADIGAMHRARGFSKIGYHYFIRKNGWVETGRDMSQPGKFEVGAHCRGSNSNSVAVCVEGGVTLAAPDVGVDNRTQAQINAQIALVRELLVRFPNAKVEGHRDMPDAVTQCPGYDAAAWWASVVRQPVVVHRPAQSDRQSLLARMNALLTAILKGIRK
jgi:N-acetylmuramoyl-L-alanine amidase